MFSYIPIIIKWWFTCEILSLIAFPIVFAIFKNLSDKGYPLSKSFGILSTVYLMWILGSIRVVKFNLFSLVIIIFLLLLLSAYIFIKKKAEIKDFLDKKKIYILFIELLFIISFGIFCYIRSFTPEITFVIRDSAAEKFTNFNIFNSLYRTDYFPPLDTWLSGYYVNYYYFGHLQWVTLAKLSHTAPSVAFNLSIATLFALVIINSFSLFYNLICSSRIYPTNNNKCNESHCYTKERIYAFPTTNYIFLGAFALLGSLAIAVFGNWDSLMQLVLNKGLPGFDFWRSSRIINDTVNEFPYFSFILGDLHAHTSSLHSFILAIILVLNFSLNKKEELLKGINISQFYPFYLVASVLIGITIATNTWDSFVLLIIFALMLFFTFYRASNSFYFSYVFSTIIFGIIILSSMVFALPFLLFFSPPTNTIFFVDPIYRTKFTDYLVHFGLFLIPITFFLFSVIYREIIELKKKKRIFHLLSFVAIFVIFSTLFGIMLAGFLIVIMYAIGLLLIRFKWYKNREIAIIFLFVFIGGLLSLFCEIYVFDDTFQGSLMRYNTVFKIYYTVWIFYSISAVYSIYALMNFKLRDESGVTKSGATFMSHCKERSRPFPTKSIILIIYLILIGIIYPICATLTRTGNFGSEKNFTERHPRGLDGLLYLKNIYGFDYQAINFINEKIKGKPVILEVSGIDDKYSEVSRIATNTGCQAILGWAHHEANWRGRNTENNIFDKLVERAQDIETIYNSSDWEVTINLLNKYNVEYIYVDELEIMRYGKKILEKFNLHFPKIFQYEDSYLFKVK